MKQIINRGSSSHLSLFAITYCRVVSALLDLQIETDRQIRLITDTLPDLQQMGPIPGHTCLRAYVVHSVQY